MKLNRYEFTREFSDQFHLMTSKYEHKEYSVLRRLARDHLVSDPNTLRSLVNEKENEKKKINKNIPED